MKVTYVNSRRKRPGVLVTDVVTNESGASVASPRHEIFGPQPLTAMAGRQVSRLNHIAETMSITTDIINYSSILAWVEFGYSTANNEFITLDIATECPEYPDPVSVAVVRNSFSIQREGFSQKYRVSFDVRRTTTYI